MAVGAGVGVTVGTAGRVGAVVAVGAVVGLTAGAQETVTITVTRVKIKNETSLLIRNLHRLKKCLQTESYHRAFSIKVKLFSYIALTES